MRGRQASKHAQFGKVPYAVVASGAIARLGLSEMAVYIVLMAHTSGENWVSFPSVATIAKSAGIGTRTTQRALAKLREKGIISIRTGGGRGLSSKYTLTINPVNLSDTLCTTNPVTIADTVSKENPVIQGDTVISVKGVKSDVKGVTQGDTRTEENKESCAPARRRGKLKGNSAHQNLISYFTERWSELIGGGGKYPFAKGRDGKAVKTILDAVTGDVERAKAIVDFYLTDDDPWLVENGKGRALGLLASNGRLTQYLAATASRSVTPDKTLAAVEHPFVADARAKWPDDVAANLEKWQSLAQDAEAGRIPGNAVLVSNAETGEQFRAEHNQEPVRVAN